MTGKLNLFTLLIFVYSIVVCATFKKDLSQNLIGSSAQVIKQSQKPKDGIAIVKDIVKNFPSIANFSNTTSSK